MRNHVILEGAWGLGKTSVAKQFAEKFDYHFVPEPSHLTDTDSVGRLNLQQWYRDAHRAHESALQEDTPQILERSLLSVHAFEYARDSRLPDEDEMLRLRGLFEGTKTMVAVLSAGADAYHALEYSKQAIETVQSVLADPECVKRYFEFYEQILPWRFGIVPLILPPMNLSTGRDAAVVASEIREAIGGQRVAQVNVVCVDIETPDNDPKLLVLKRTASRGGFWQAITGGIHPGEPLFSVALREIEEETGIVVSKGDLYPTRFAHSFLGGTGYQLTEYVFAARIRQPDLVHRSEEHDEFRWVFEEEAKVLMAYESNRQALVHALATIKKPVR